ncbi:hypothetical protein ACQP2P_01995 [Dactylosporangium sp. CA-139114]|uniref:hypothetical protein n=1 Tax=Dactylosporangium sp. CA-139114 TaxID=3239931 RepID=UPI003D959C40
MTDAAYSPTRILAIDTEAGRDHDRGDRDSAAGAPVGCDAEGMYARPQGGFWLGVEAATGDGNKLVRLDANGGRSRRCRRRPRVGATKEWSRLGRTSHPVSLFRVRPAWLLR